MAYEKSDASFVVSYEEPLTQTKKEFILSYWKKDRSVSLFDKKLKRFFLKRIVPPESLSLDNLYVGATITVCSRSLTVIGFGDAPTERAFLAAKQNAILLIKPDAYYESGKIIQMVYNANLGVGRMRMVKFSQEEAQTFLSLTPAKDPQERVSSAGSAFHNYDPLSGSLSHADTIIPTRPSDISMYAIDCCLAIEVTGDDALTRLQEIAGPSDPDIAREVLPKSIRAVFGKSKRENAVHVSLFPSSALSEIAYIFERNYPFTAIATHCSAVILKPHVVAAKNVGKIIDIFLSQGLEISALRSVNMKRDDAADFLEAYTGVCVEYDRWITEMSSGPCVILEVRGDNIINRVREIAGPYDVAVARILAPNSIRSQFGIDNVRNAVHVTDIDVDGPLEVKFCFSVLN